MRKHTTFALSALLAHALAAEDCTKSDIAQGTSCIINSNQTAEVSNGTLTNNGSLIFEKNSSLKFKTTENKPTILTNSITGIAGEQRGKIEIRGTGSSIDASGSEFSIKNQDISFGNQADKFSIKAKSFTLGDDSALVTFTGRQSSSTLTLDGTETLKIQNTNLKNIHFSGTSLKTLNLKKASLENASIQSTQALEISKANPATAASGEGANDNAKINIKGKNYIISNEKLSLKTGLDLEGGGLLVLRGKTVEVGNGTQIALNGQYSKEQKEKSTLGLHSQSEGVLFKKVASSNLRIQIIKDGQDGARLKNIESSFNGGVLEGRDASGASQVLIIENGNSSTQAYSSSPTPAPIGKISIGKIAIGASAMTLATDESPKSTTFQGAGIKIYGQEITIGDNSRATQAHTLIMQTDGDKGEIALGKENTGGQNREIRANSQNKDGDVIIQGKNGGSPAQNLQLRGSKLSFDGDVSLKNLSIQTQSGDTAFRIIGKSDKSVLSLESANFEAGIIDEKGKGKYQSLYFLSEENGLRSKLQVKSEITLKASDFIFENQNTELTQGKSLNLYAYGAVDLPKDSTQAKAEKIGSFVFNQVRFESKKDAQVSNGQSLQSTPTQMTLQTGQNTTTTLKLYSGEEGAKIYSKDLVLKDVNLESYVIAANLTMNQLASESANKNTLDLSDKASNLTALGTVSIDAKDFKYSKDGKRLEGVGMDLFVGDKSEVGKLTLKSSANTAKEGEDPSFVLGGNLTIDNTAQTNGGGAGAGLAGVVELADGGGSQSSFDIEMGSKKLSNHEISLIVEGGLSVIHKNVASQSTEVKAKNFDFEVGSRVYSKNGTLKLSSETGQIEIKGKTILEGTETAKASIEANKKNGASGRTDETKLTLHDVEVRGSAELSKSFAFKNSNLFIYGDGTNKTFTIKGNTSPLKGIQSITLQAGILDVQNGNSKTNQELQLNQGAIITSSGESELKTTGISIDSVASANRDASNASFVLKVLDGRLKITETTAKNAIGAITLGQKENKIGANLELIKSNNGSTSYNALKIKAPLISYGDSSILAASFSVETTGLKQPLFSIIGGELKLIAKGAGGASNLQARDAVRKEANGTQSLKIETGELSLKDGSLSFYNPENKLGEIALGKLNSNPSVNAAMRGDLSSSSSSSKITSIGTSSIQASKLTIQGSEIDAKNGSLDLIGLDASSKFANLTLNGAGLSAFNSSKNARESIKLLSGKTITMIASSPFVSPARPLGGASFGQIVAKTVEFEGDSTASQKLINLKVSQTEGLSGEALFFVREGDQILIETSEGIKKNSHTAAKQTGSKITLEDISLDTGGYRSLRMTPKLIENKAKDQVLSLVLGVSVKQTNILELAESIESKKKREEMFSVLKEGRLEEIADSILLSQSNPLKVGLAENTIRGDVSLVSEVLYYLQDGIGTLAQMAQTHYKLYEQISMLSLGTLQNRLSRLGNPHSFQEEIAQLLQNLSKNTYASSEDEVLLDELPSTMDKGGLWAAYSGANRSGKDISANVSGLSAGYDVIFDGKILFGGFVSYLYGAYKEKFLREQSHNIHFGLYSRMAFGGNEIDWSLSQMIGINAGTLNLGTNVLAGISSGELKKYNFYATDLQLRYGYSFALGEEDDPYYLKPFVGLKGAFLFSKDLQTQASLAIKASGMKDFFLDLSAGLELRKYLNPQSYFFVMPLVEAGVFETKNEVQAGFVESAPLSYEFEKYDGVNVGLYAGGEGSVAKNLMLIGNVGVKMGVKNVNVLTSWNLGLKYKF